MDQDDGVYHRKVTISISRELKPPTLSRARSSKVPYVSKFFSKAGSIGLEVLDTLGSSMTNLNAPSGFVSNTASRGSKVSILAFEVANTIVKGSNLMQSLSDENIQILKKDILHSEEVQLLVSMDMEELLSIAAADKREEFEVFWREVVRFGDMCRDPQWHNMDRYFDNLYLDPVTNKRLREEAEITMQELTSLAQHTSELCHELVALDRLEQNYHEVESLHLPRKGESLMILQSELKHQRKLVRNLKKNSLWFKSLDKVVEKLVDVVIFIHQAIVEAFEENAASSTMNGKKTNKNPKSLGVADLALHYANLITHMDNITSRPASLPPCLVSAASSTMNGKKTNKNPKSLGVAGLALHYANLITHMDNIASRPASLPPNTRDTFYNSLPASVKAGLRSHLQALGSKEVMTTIEVKAEMEKTLHWLVPVATDTIKAHRCFGFVGEWANTGNEFGMKTAGSDNIIRLQTLYHADKHTMDLYILELIILLHRLISLVRYGDEVPKYTQLRTPPTSKGLNLHPNGKLERIPISLVDKNLLEEVTKGRLLVPRVSRSEELVKW